MTHTFYQHLYHIIWSTKERKSLILPEFKKTTFAFLAGAFKTAGCIPIEIGRMADHVHALVKIPPKYAISEIIRDVKVCSSKWYNANFASHWKFSWQEGFGSFTVSTSQQATVHQYILNQEDHHKIHTFKEEFTKFLEIHKIEYDEKFLWH